MKTNHWLLLIVYCPFAYCLVILALRARWVGERSCCSEAHGVNRGGAARSENAGMSSV
jgi:hypothetical protein